WALRYVKSVTILTQAALTIVKPTGFIYGAVVSLLNRRLGLAAAVAWIPFAIWLLRDVLLWRNATISPSSTSVTDIVSTTIAGHGMQGLQLMATALWRQGVPTICLFVLPFLGPWLGAIRRE